MKPTNKIAHFSNGGNSVLGLPVSVDDHGAEFVRYQDEWLHVSEVPLKSLHVVERSQVAPKRIPQFRTQPVSPDLPAFKPTTLEQRTAPTVK